MAKKQPNDSPPKRTPALEKLLLSDYLKPSHTNPDLIDEKADDFFYKVSNRQKIHGWIDEYVVTEEFINRIRRYARQEFDSMLLKVFIWFSGIAVGTILGILLTALIAGKFKK